jgi:hypothetical protein
MTSLIVIRGILLVLKGFNLKEKTLGGNYVFFGGGIHFSLQCKYTCKIYVKKNKLILFAKVHSVVIITTLTTANKVVTN